MDAIFFIHKRAPLARAPFGLYNSPRGESNTISQRVAARDLAETEPARGDHEESRCNRVTRHVTRRTPSRDSRLACTRIKVFQLSGDKEHRPLSSALEI